MADRKDSLKLFGLYHPDKDSLKNKTLDSHISHVIAESPSIAAKEINADFFPREEGRYVSGKIYFLGMEGLVMFNDYCYLDNDTPIGNHLIRILREENNFFIPPNVNVRRKKILFPALQKNSKNELNLYTLKREDRAELKSLAFSLHDVSAVLGGYAKEEDKSKKVIIPEYIFLEAEWEGYGTVYSHPEFGFITTERGKDLEFIVEEVPREKFAIQRGLYLHK